MIAKRWPACALALLAAAGGLLTLLAQWGGAPGLIQPPGSIEPIRPIAAAWFVTFGLAAALLGTPGQRLGRLLAASALVTAIGVITTYVLEHELDRQWGIWGSLPAPSAAFAFVMIGCAVLLVAGVPTVTWWRPAAVALCAAAAIVPLESMLQQVLGGSSAHLPGADIPPLTAILMLPLAGSVLLASFTRRDSGPSSRADWFSALFTAAMASALFITWVHLENRDWRERKMDAARTATLIADGLSARVTSQSSALRRLAQRWSVYGEPARDQWLRDTESLAEDFPGWSALYFLDDSGAIRWQQALPGTDIAHVDLPDLWEPMLQLTPATVVVRGNQVIYVSTVIADGKVHGYVVSEARLGELLRLSGGPMLKDFGVAMYSGASLLLEDEQKPASASLRQSAPAVVPGARWTVVAWPKPQYMERLGTALPEMMLLLGLAALGAMVMNFVLARRATQSNQAAKEIADRLSNTLESLTDAFLTVNRHMEFTFVNAAAEKLLERPRSELVGRNAWESFPEAVGTPFQSNAEKALGEHCTVFFEEYYAPLAKWLNAKFYPSPEGLAVYMQDVTALRRSREALRERERELAVLAEAMPQIVWMTDPAGHVIYVNNRWSEFTGLPAEHASGGAWHESVHPDDLGAVRRMWARALAGGGEHSVEFRVRSAGGQWRWMLSRAVRFHDDTGRVVKWIGAATDIHDLKTQSESLRQSNERFMLVTRATNDGIWELDIATGQVWLSDSFIEAFGALRGNEVKLEDCLQRIHEEDRPRVAREMDEAVRSGAERWSAQYRLRRTSGKYAVVLNRAYLQRDAAGQALRMVGSMTDVTHRLALEEQLRQSQRLETVGHLTGGVAHDFNNLLTVILGNAETLEQELDDREDLQSLARLVLQAAERGAALTHRLLAFSRKQALEPSTIALEAQLQKMEPLLRRTLGEHIHIRTCVAANLWRAHVDPAQLDSALLNLCVNARDAMPAGGALTIEATNAVLDAEYGSRMNVVPGEYILLAVSDSGAGISPEHLPHIFEPFFTTKEKGKGTGLGLAMVYGFMKQSRGHIDVYSEVGKGTTFKLYLPRCTASAGAKPQESETQESETQESEPAAGSILLVEDEPLVRAYGASQLRSLGYRVIEVSSGQEALDALLSGLEVDLLFTDVVMPAMSGPQLVERAQQLRPGLRVLYTSGYTDNALVHHGTLDAGVHLLRKPYMRRELARQVRAALRPRAEGSQSEHELRATAP